jgi:hypothetical protein
MRFSRLHVLLLVLGLLPLAAWAQVKPVGHRAHRTSDAPVNLIKFNPYMILHGYLPLSYERLLFSRLGVELGGGPTTKDFVYHAFQEIDEGIDTNKGEFAEAEMGYGLFGALRLYLSDGREKPPAGAFLAMQLQHRYHEWIQNYDLQVNSSRGRLISRANSRQLTDFVFLAGYQGVFAGGLAVEINGGLGIRNRVVERYRVDFSEIALEEDRPSKATLVFPINIKIGYAF